MLRNLWHESLGRSLPLPYVLSSFGTYLSSPKIAVTLGIDIINVATGTLLLTPSADGCILWTVDLKNISVPHYSVSILLNVLLTLMIVARLVLHSRNIRTSTGVAGIGGLCRVIITMLIESSVIYATSSLLVLLLLSTGRGGSNGFMFILVETQVRALPRSKSLDRLSNVTTNWTGHRSTAHHSASRQQDRANEQHRRLQTYQYVQGQEPRGINGR